MTRVQLLKSLAPGFLPLIVFIVADSIWGTRIGLAVAVAVGVIELTVSYLKEKTVDKFVLLDVAFIVVLGTVSILLDNAIFFKLKPALIEAIFCGILAVSIYSPSNILLLMSRRYMKGVEFNPAQLTQLKKSMKALLYIFLAHTLLILYSVFFLSKEAWAFISGGLFYLLFGAYFVIELSRKWLRRRRWESTYGDDEWFDLVDSEGRVTGRAPRTVCHMGPGMLHPVIHMHVLDSKDRIYLQKRAGHKEIQPGKWDTAVGGHIKSGESVEDALKRETAEELGLRNFEARLIGRYIWESEVESELVLMFFCRTDQAVRFNREEIEDGRFWRVKKIRENLGKGLFTPNFEHEFPLLMGVLYNK